MRDLTLPRWTRLVISFVAAVVMGLFCSVVLSGEKITPAGVISASISFALVYAVALALLSLSRETELMSGFTFAVLAMATLVFIRVCLLYYHSADYTTFLVRWVESLRNMKVAEALSTPVGDYNVPYLYLLLIISRIPAPDIVFIKAISCIFDMLLGYSVMLCVRRFTESKGICLLSFILTCAIPTVILNGSMWAQCDSIYGFFCVMTVYYALCGRGRPAMIMFGLAFAFKLQAIFLAPAIIICLFVGRIKLRHLVWFPIVNLLAVLPSVICGRNIVDVFSIYLKQTQNYPSLDMNAPTVFRFVFNVEFDWFNMLGIMFAGFGVLCMLYFAFYKRDRIDARALLAFFWLSAMAVPYFLPRMHERYFFVADVLSLALFIVARKLWYVPVITIFSSFVAYAYFLFKGVTLVNYIWVAFALLIVIALVIKDLYKYMNSLPEQKKACEVAQNG